MRQQARKVRTKFDKNTRDGEIWGWFNGKGTYLGFGSEEGGCIGTLSGHKLYRLAKAITCEWEQRYENK